MKTVLFFICCSILCLGIALFNSGCEIDDSSSSSLDQVNYASLDWCWGGEKCGGAQLVDGCEIDNLHCNNSGMSYSWVEGGCEALGASSASDASCWACLFVKQGGSWRGGKIDWISTSRRSRDFKNPNSGYHGWDPNAIANANEFAFVIVKGNKRSNVIYFNR